MDIPQTITEALNEALDAIRADTPELSFEQAVIKTTTINIYALVMNCAEAGMEQNRPDSSVVIEFGVIAGMLQSLHWLNDQYELSTMDLRLGDPDG